MPVCMIIEIEAKDPGTYAECMEKVPATVIQYGGWYGSGPTLIRRPVEQRTEARARELGRAAEGRAHLEEPRLDDARASEGRRASAITGSGGDNPYDGRLSPGASGAGGLGGVAPELRPRSVTGELQRAEPTCRHRARDWNVTPASSD